MHALFRSGSFLRILPKMKVFYTCHGSSFFPVVLSIYGNDLTIPVSWKVFDDIRRFFSCTFGGRWWHRKHTAGFYTEIMVHSARVLRGYHIFPLCYYYSLDPGKGGSLFMFRLFSQFYFVLIEFHSIFFKFLIKYYHVMFLIIVVIR